MRIVEAAETTGLTTLVNLRLSLFNTTTSTWEDDYLSRLIQTSSSAIREATGYDFYRAVFEEETPPRNLWVETTLSQVPVASIHGIYDGEGNQLSDGSSWIIADPIEGKITSKIERTTKGFIRYTGGWMLPGENRADAGVELVDPDVIRLPSTIAWPTHLVGRDEDATKSVLGDFISMGGWTGTESIYNETYRVTHRVDDQDVRVEPIVATQAATGEVKSIGIQTLPAELEQSCIDLCTYHYQRRGRSPALTQISFTEGTSVRYDREWLEKFLKRLSPFARPGSLAADTLGWGMNRQMVLT